MRSELFPKNGNASHDRVRDLTDPMVNEKIDKKAEECLRFYSAQSPETITERIQQLDEEWDVERWIEANASSLALAGLVLGFTVNRKWLLLPVATMSFLLWHATRGWCPPIPVLRRAGIRTRKEIDAEKYALKFLRGDFDEAREVYENTLKAVAAFEACLK